MTTLNRIHTKESKFLGPSAAQKRSFLGSAVRSESSFGHHFLADSKKARFEKLSGL